MSDQAPLAASYEQWVEIHAQSFKDYGFPEEVLGKALYAKLMGEQMDAGAFFGIDTQADPTLIYVGQQPLAPYSNVFISE